MTGRVKLMAALALVAAFLACWAGLANRVSLPVVVLRTVLAAVLFAGAGFLLALLWEGKGPFPSGAIPDFSSPPPSGEHPASFQQALGQRVDFTLDREVPTPPPPGTRRVAPPEKET